MKSNWKIPIQVKRNSYKKTNTYGPNSSFMQSLKNTSKLTDSVELLFHTMISI